MLFKRIHTKRGATKVSTSFFYTFLKGLCVFLLATTLPACKSTKGTGHSEHHNTNNNSTNSNSSSRQKRTETLLNTAFEYRGTPYRTAGTDKNGMDCSGLVWTSFKSIDIAMPRTSHDQSIVGNEVSLSELEKGDLVFFGTNPKSKGEVNHVGIVTQKKEGTYYFIHATLKGGVMENNLEEKYYKEAFIKARRVY
jgi:probable lipoprotein NlpC